MRDVAERGRHLGHAARRENERIAAGEDDFPDFRMRAHVVERGRELGVGQRGALARADHLAAEAEAAIDRADADELQQHAVGVAVHDARHRALQVVTDRIGVLGRVALELARIGNELQRDRVVGIGPIDQLRHRRRYRDGVARSDHRDLGGARVRNEARIGEIARRRQCSAECGHDSSREASDVPQSIACRPYHSEESSAAALLIAGTLLNNCAPAFPISRTDGAFQCMRPFSPWNTRRRLCVVIC